MIILNFQFVMVDAALPNPWTLADGAFSKGPFPNCFWREIRGLQGFWGYRAGVDGYAGYNRLLAPDRSIRRAYCWAHARRKLTRITRMGPAPIAREGLRLIRALYAIEAEVSGSDPEARLAGTPKLSIGLES